MDEKLSGIDIDIENYKVIRLDNTNIAIQIRKSKSTGEVYYENIGYYSSEEAAFRKLFTLVTRDTNKASIAEAVNTYVKCSNFIIEALRKG